GKDVKGKPLPPRVSMPEAPENIKKLLDAIARRAPEQEALALAAEGKPEEINKAIDEMAGFRAKTEEEGDGPCNNAKALVKKVKKEDATAAKAAWFDMEQRRYGGESFMELQLGFLYDARVRVVTAVSDHHRKRSENFFYSMLAAQIGAVVSTLALSRKTSTTLWLLAALFGLSP